MNPTDLILIAVMKDKRDFEIARVLGWYRIPVSTAPRTLLVDYVAFYQTARFGEEKWAINYYAAVKGHELATRRELLRTEPDHPRASEQYYKVQIGPLQRLPRPVPSRRWRRLTFVYTTGRHLLEADDVGELVVHSAERTMLWRALRERGLLTQPLAQAQRRESELELDATILCALGSLGIRLGEGPKKVGEGQWVYLTYPASGVQSELDQWLDEITQIVDQLGGVKTDI